MKIQNLELRGFLSFDSSEQTDITFDDKITVLIGKNNSGKSNILKALKKMITLGKSKQLSLNSSEIYMENAELNSNFQHTCLGVNLSLSSDEEAPVLKEINAYIANQVKTNQIDQINAISTIGVKCTGTENVNKKFLLSLSLNGKEKIDVSSSSADNMMHFQICNELLSILSDKIIYISGWRQLDSKIEANSTIINRLHVMSSPPANQYHLLPIFDRVQSFFRKLSGLNNAELKVSPDGKELNIFFSGRYLPIQSFGDGIIHTLIMAFHFMTKTESVFLIEEPETHLHPELLRLLFNEMQNDSNNNQFIITTHSPVLLNNLMQSTIYSIKNNGNNSEINSCKTTKDIHEVLDSLGVCLSDLLQSNCIIWVEGPSDRIFINKCLSLLCPELQEGLHYQICFYGGKVLAHYSVDCESNNESDFVELIKLCRNVAIIADSDRESENTPICKTKERIDEEIQKNNRGLFWLTSGREIENYIPDKVFQRAYSGFFPEEDVSSLSLGKYERLESKLIDWMPKPKHGSKWKISYADNKTKLMPEFMKVFTENDISTYDLNDKIKELILFIKESNSTLV